MKTLLTDFIFQYNPMCALVVLSMIPQKTILNTQEFFSIVIGMEGLSITMGRGGLRWYTSAQVTAGQSVEAGYSIVQQVSKSYFDAHTQWVQTDYNGN